MNQTLDQSNFDDQTFDLESSLVVGLDWADSKHDATVLDRGRKSHFRFDADPATVEDFIAELTRIAGGRNIAVCVEKGRVRIIYHLMLRENITLYPVDPKQVARYRQSFTSSTAKDDSGDSYYLARLLAERGSDMRALQPDDAITRKIALLSQTRRSLVDDKTAVIQQLTAKVKMIHPVALMLPVSKIDSTLVREFLRRYPDPRKANKAHVQTLTKMLARSGIKNPERVEEIIHTIRSTPLATSDGALIEPLVIYIRAMIGQLDKLDEAIGKCDQEIASAMNQCPDAKLFTSLPGAGAALAPRLLTTFGSNRDRFESADQLCSYVGIAPVTRQSGKKRQVVRRRACPKFLLQTFHEFAGCVRRFCPWSGAYYRWQRDKGVGHHAALRKLATRWARILYRVWQTREPYDADRYLASMYQKNHPLIQFLQPT
jgi:transposase